MTKTGEAGNEHNPWGKGNVFFKGFRFRKVLTKIQINYYD
jgi:hypothetical protein